MTAVKHKETNFQRDIDLVSQSVQKLLHSIK